MSKSTKSTPVTIFTTGKLGEPSKIVQFDKKFIVVSSYTGKELPSLPNIGDPAYDKDGKPIFKNGKPVFYHGAILTEGGEVLVHRTTPQQKNLNSKIVFVGNAILFDKTSGYGGYQILGSGLGAHDGPGGKTVSGWGPGSYGGYGAPSDLGAYDGPGGTTITGWGPGTTVGTSYDDVSHLTNTNSSYINVNSNSNNSHAPTTSSTSNTSSKSSSSSSSSSSGWGPGTVSSYSSNNSDTFGDYSGPSGFSY